MKNEPILTQEQQKLATAKEKISEALQEINNELKTVSGYLPKVSKLQQLEFISELVNVQDQLEKYLDEAESELKNYSSIRKKLASFADREDIFFIPKLLNPTRDYAHTIVSVLKKCQEGLFKHPDTTSEQEVENVVSLHMFFKGYIKTLENMWQDYEDLYEAVYTCDKTEHEKRFNIQYESYITKQCSKNKTNDIYDNIFNKLFDIFKDDEYNSYYEKLSECIVIDESFVTTTKKKATFTTRKIIDISKIHEMQDYVGQCMQRIVPYLCKEEFTKKEDLANYIHEHKLEHHQTNILIAGYYRLHLLEQISETIAQQKTTQTAVGRKAYEFSSDFDYEMLSRVFTNTYEQEKHYINAHSKNVFAALFLIAMHNMNVYLVNGKVQAFCKLIKKLCGWKLCVKSVQDLITQCSNYLYNKITCQVSRKRLQRYMEIAARLMHQLEKLNLIIA